MYCFFPSSWLWKVKFFQRACTRVCTDIQCEVFLYLERVRLTMHCCLYLEWDSQIKNFQNWEPGKYFLASLNFGGLEDTKSFNVSIRKVSFLCVSSFHNVCKQDNHCHYYIRKVSFGHLSYWRCNKYSKFGNIFSR